MSQNNKVSGSEIAWNDAQKRIAALKKDFQEGFQAPLRELPEVIFRQHFLDWFAGEIKDTDGELRRQWIAVAGNEFSEVQIINPKHEALITIPALCNRDIFKISTGSGKRAISTIVSDAFFHSELSVNAVGKDMADKLGGVVKGGEANETADALRWKEVLAYFGKTLSPSKTEAKGEGSSDSGLNLSYED